MLTTQFKATNFIPALSTYIHCLIPPPAIPVLPNHIDWFEIYKCITIHRSANPAAGFPESVDQLRATPLVPAKGRIKAVPAHFDTVLVQAVDDNQHMQGTCLEGMSFIRSLYCFVYTYKQMYITRNI